MKKDDTNEKRKAECVFRASRFTLHGFSLIEMLIVMVLMILMYVMLYGPASKNYQSEQKAACAKNLQQVYVALKIYAAENGGKYPVLESAMTSEAPLSLLVPKYTTMTDGFICPGSGDHKLPSAEPFAAGRISYCYYMGRMETNSGAQPLMSDRQVNGGTKLKGDSLFSLDGKAPGNNHRKFGGTVLFCDGRALELEPITDRDLTFDGNVKLLSPKD